MMQIDGILDKFFKITLVREQTAKMNDLHPTHPLIRSRIHWRAVAQISR